MRVVGVAQVTLVVSAEFGVNDERNMVLIGCLFGPTKESAREDGAKLRGACRSRCR